MSEGIDPNYDGSNKLFDYVAASNLDPVQKVAAAGSHAADLLSIRRNTVRRSLGGVGYRVSKTSRFLPQEQAPNLNADTHVRIASAMGENRPGWSRIIFDATRRARSGSFTGLSQIEFSGAGIVKVGEKVIDPATDGFGEEADFIYESVEAIALGLDGRHKESLSRGLEATKGYYQALRSGERFERGVAVGVSAATLLAAAYGPQVISGDRDTIWPQPIEAFNDWANSEDHAAQGIAGHEDAAVVRFGEGVIEVPYVSHDVYGPDNVPSAIYGPFSGPAHQDVRPGTWRVRLGYGDHNAWAQDDVDEFEAGIADRGCTPVRGDFDEATTTIVMNNRDLEGDLTIEAVRPGIAQLCLDSGDALNESHGTVIMTQQVG